MNQNTIIQKQPFPSAEKIDNQPQAFYTSEQVEQIVAEAVAYAMQHASAVHLDSSIPQPSPAITVAEAAQMIRISKPSMYELIRSNQVHSIRVGKKILVSRRSLLDWVEGRKQ